MSNDLPKSMPAVICHAPEDYRLEEHAVPSVDAGEVIIRVDSVGICASDLKCYQGAPLFWGDENREGYCQAPIIPGHEFAGTVVAMGEGAGEKHGLKLGETNRRRIGTDRPLWRLSLLSARSLLDVRRTRHLRLQAGDVRRDG